MITAVMLALIDAFVEPLWLYHSSLFTAMLVGITDWIGVFYGT
jgi:hypothetical protein